MKPIPYATQWIDKEDVRAVVSALNSANLTQGPLVERFEQKVAKYCGAKYAVAVNSGTSALHLACMAAGITKDDEVITSPITFVASANCVLYCGGKPVFADILEETVTIDPKEVEKNISKRTKAVIPVDFSGQPADLAEIRTIADKHNLVVIEDAAHSLGAKYKGERIGSGKYADMTVFSFHAVKQITTGEGGMVLTNNRDYYEKLKILRTHGIIRNRALSEKNGGWYYEMRQLGFNYRLTDIQCALGISQLKKANRFLARRKEIVNKYNWAFSACEGVTCLSERPSVESAHHLYILRFAGHSFSIPRKFIFDEYRRNGIGVNIHYLPAYLHPYYKKLGYKRGECPRAEQYYKEAITLPLYPRMSEHEIDKVIRITKGIVYKYAKRIHNRGHS